MQLDITTHRWRVFTKRGDLIATLSSLDCAKHTVRSTDSRNQCYILTPRGATIPYLHLIPAKGPIQ